MKVAGVYLGARREDGRHVTTLPARRACLVEEGNAYKYCGILEHQIDGELIDKWYGDSKTQVYLDFIGEHFSDE
ncbi:hypothetical protein P7H19_10495 [Paenibacillus larvae]|nr:hypothetical protein [Paenibacillus larvae]MDT2236634.1 hypothetical protein [Paenibacillus larvae]